MLSDEEVSCVTVDKTVVGKPLHRATIRAFVAETFREVRHVLIPDVRRQGVDRHQVHVVEIDRILAVYAVAQIIGGLVIEQSAQGVIKGRYEVSAGYRCGL
ncbi:hypothetical protein SAMN05421504_1031001 [Amycolatopsis xylanica]|uniref:Uncharacterized protein n=1 Tax=Amycolatopsis xylanica TaxID=589385 RepID=A0A1H3EVM5_9PSEU|nr:hypothetical protein SAMN05421504_1031001 [Amycolatopsis xylanica]